MLTLECSIAGLPPAHGRDGSVYGSHHPSPLHCQEKAVHVRLVDPSPKLPALPLRFRYQRLTPRGVFSFISENPIVAKLQYGLKITFIFILILFIDSVNRVYRVQIELAQASEGSGAAYVSPETPSSPLRPCSFIPFLVPPSANPPIPSSRQVMGHERLEVQARKFYSQRNMYLCGFTLFLSLILNRTYIMILDVLRLEERVKQYEGVDKSGKGGKEAAKLAQAGDVGEIARLKKELTKKDKDIETLKKQCDGLQREYNSLSDKLTQQDGTPKKDI